MKIETRNKRIKKSKKHIKEIAKFYHISYERARQIIRDEELKRKKEFQKIIVEYSKKVKFLIKNNLKGEIKRLSNKGRNKKIIIQKVILIKSLKDDFEFPLTKIGRLLGNDYTTIHHLYNSYSTKIKPYIK